MERSIILQKFSKNKKSISYQELIESACLISREKKDAACKKKTQNFYLKYIYFL